MSSPSEFLTFYRSIRASRALGKAPRQCLYRPAASRAFTTATRTQKDQGPGRDHVLDKAPGKGDHQTNIQSEQSKKGRDARASGGADSTTSQRDTAKQKDKIKKENPEAPDNIGFQDERGGKAG